MTILFLSEQPRVGKREGQKPHAVTLSHKKEPNFDHRAFNLPWLTLLSRSSSTCSKTISFFLALSAFSSLTSGPARKKQSASCSEYLQNISNSSSKHEMNISTKQLCSLKMPVSAKRLLTEDECSSDGGVLTSSRTRHMVFAVYQDGGR